MKRVFHLVHKQARQRALAEVACVPDGHVVTISEPTRGLAQNAKFHALCSDLARARVAWAGKPRTAEEWKVLLISGHAVATKQGGEIVPGLEGEFVAIRESSAAMSKARASSLIEYAVAFAAQHGIETGEPLAA